VATQVDFFDVGTQTPFTVTAGGEVDTSAPLAATTFQSRPAPIIRIDEKSTTRVSHELPACHRRFQNSVEKYPIT
jgi:hypothetical protein